LTLEIAKDTPLIYLESQNPSIRKTAQIVHEKHGKAWSVTGLTNWLLNPVLCGDTPYLTGKHPRSGNYVEQIIEYNTHPDQALLTRQQQAQIRNQLQINRTNSGHQKGKWINPFRGLVYCAYCQTSMDFTNAPSGGKTVRYATCRVHRKSIGRTCPNTKYTRLELIESATIDALIDRAKEINLIVIDADQILESPEVINLRSQLHQLQSIPGNNPAIAAAIQDLQAQLETARLKSQSLDLNQSELKNDLVKVFGDRVFWDTFLKNKLTPYELQGVYKQFVDKIWIKDGRVLRVDLRI
jgi:hypothetical protein